MREILRGPVRLWGLLAAAGVLIFSATLAGFAGRFWWVFDLFSHFRVQYLFLISVVILLLLLGKKWRSSAVLSLCAAINLASILPYYLPGDAAAGDATTPLRVASINVNTANRKYDLVRQYIIDNSPDIVLLMEVNAAWDRALEELHSLYPYRVSEPRPDNFGIVLFSRRPLIKGEIVYLGEARAPSVIAELEIAERKLTIFGAHLSAPMSDTYYRLRNEQAEAIGAYLSSVPGPKMLIGDLNMSPWSYYFGRLLGVTGLSDSSTGRGIHLTWPTHTLWMRIPIDFCLVSEEILVNDKTVGPNIGSDHFPVLVDIML
ncbi:MAG TPA: endonuclease/exonuclease/phosphatase family protein [Blastocatellia bacterium]|nr:endonuclease/exonuclease/phosphatase family protein [Blastocatellia bacterium]